MKHEGDLSAALVHPTPDPMSASSIALFGEISRQIGAESVLIELERAGREIAAEAARTVWRHPRLVELEEVRRPDYRPCPAKCRACSRCVASEAYWSRGGRPYLGVEQERHRGEQHHEVDGEQHHEVDRVAS